MTRGLVLDHVTLAIAGRVIVDVSLAVEPGTIVSVMGPSGVGKSSLLAFVAGFLDRAFTAGGQLLLDGEDLTTRPPAQRHIGLLFQDPMLFPHMSVGGNLLFAIPPRVRGRKARHAVAERYLSSVSLDGFFGRDPASLSGGQKTRAALARVLASEPRALLLDEPFSALDRPLRAQMRQLVFDTARRLDLPVLLVTHDQEDAAAAGGPVIALAEPACDGGCDKREA